MCLEPRKISSLGPRGSNLGSFFTSAFFVSTEKRGPKNRIVPKNNVPVFPSQDFVTTSKKQAVVRTLSFFSYTRKTGTQKTGRSFRRCPRRHRYLFVASRRAGPTRTKILKRDNTTTNSRFMIDLVAEMLFEKTAWCFCAARMLVKNGPKPARWWGRRKGSRTEKSKTPKGGG